MTSNIILPKGVVHAMDGNGTFIWDLFDGDIWIGMAFCMTVMEAFADGVQHLGITGDVHIEPWWVGKTYNQTPELPY